MVKLILALVLWGWSSSAANWEHQVELTVNTSLNSGLQNSLFNLDTADNYCPQCTGATGWLALRIPLNNALAYQAVPAFLSLDLSAAWDSAFALVLELPLQRDLEAWHRSTIGHNLIAGLNELNINVPYRAFAQWQYASGAVRGGRFKVDLGPSPHALVLGAAPAFHEALHWQQSLRKVRFDFALISLDAHLLGTPSADGGEPPAGSEAWQQRHFTVPNQRRRIYAQPAKNLLVHRLGYHSSWGHLAIIEQSMVGGKSLDLRDFNPFMFWHNNFSDGYTKSSTTLELGLRPSRGQFFYGQLNIEDIASPVGEVSGEIFPSTMGVLVGWQAQWSPQWRTSLDAVYTDPAFNNYRLPLLKMTSRQVYRSNYRLQEEPAFADTYIMDYPLGYHRGPDALDLWFNTQYNWGSHWLFALDLAWLRQGAFELWSDFDSASVAPQLSGVVEREKRAILSAQFTHKAWTFRAAGGYRGLANENHYRSPTQHQLVAELSASWRWMLSQH